jgi:tetratricopeptide (TPR) repeat protein
LRFRAVVALVGLGLALAAIPAAAQSKTQRGAVDIRGSSELARALLDEAQTAAALGDWADVRAYVDEGLVQDPADSDLLYVRALCSTKLDSSIDAAIGDLDAALASARFASYSRREAFELKAELLIHERRWKEALDAIGKTGQGPLSRSGAGEPSTLLAMARAYSGIGDRKDFDAAIEAALRRYPDETVFPRLFLAHASPTPESEGTRSIADTILRRLPGYAETDPELQVLAAPLMNGINEQRKAVLAFRSMGGASSAASLRALEYGLIGEAQAASELLVDDRAAALGDISSLLALAGSPAGRSAVAAAISAWTGTVLVDADGDGVYEGHFSLAKGKATSYDLDSRQAGSVDLHLDFADGFPSAARLLRGDASIEVSYSVFPSAASVSFTDSDGKRGYVFGPDAFRYLPVSMRAFVGSEAAAVYFPYPTSSPDPTETACAAAASSVETLRDGHRTLTMLDKGLPVSSTSYEGQRIMSITDFEKGRPARIRIDADGDGRFETRGRFAADATRTSAPEWLETDMDGDGLYEYREQTVFPFRQEWDYDGDGSVDAVRFHRPDGTIEEDFSSHLDGRLDEALVLQDGRIVSLKRDGSDIAMVPDLNPSLTWLGAKPFDLGSNLPDGEGLFSAMGKRYRLSRVGSLAFAELIP